MTISLNQSAFTTTYTGKLVHLPEPLEDEIDIVDIAHSLAQMCRFTGHTKFFYSVGYHSILASEFVEPKELALEALLHDAHEAYIADLPRPIKLLDEMAGYKAISNLIDGVIRRKYGLPITLDPRVKEVDNRLVCTEGLQLMARHHWAEGHPTLPIVIERLDCLEVRERFLDRFYDLTQ